MEDIFSCFLGFNTLTFQKLPFFIVIAVRILWNLASDIFPPYNNIKKQTKTNTKIIKIELKLNIFKQ